MWLLAIIFSVIAPRIIMALIFLFTNLFASAFHTILWPLLGFLFMPYTTLAYMGTMIYNNHHLSGAWLVLIIIAVLFDLGGQSRTYR